MESPSKRKPPLNIWQPYQPYVAKLLAHRAFELFHKPGRIPRKGENMCALCNHDNRREIDYLCLVGAPLKMKKLAMGARDNPRWDWGKFRYHRDAHLVPIIEEEVVPKPDRLKLIPYPADQPELVRMRWHQEQTYGLYIDALDKGHGQRALSCLAALRDMEPKIDILRVTAAKPVDPPAGLPAPAPQITRGLSPELEYAFAQSKMKRKPGGYDGEGKEEA